MHIPRSPDVPIFGGKTTIFGGDFRQVLPVITHGSRADIMHMCMKEWAQWPKIKILALTQNMRISRMASTPAEAQEFEAYLLRWEINPL
jgi:hypothetical protein